MSKVTHHTLTISFFLCASASMAYGQLLVNPEKKLKTVRIKKDSRGEHKQSGGMSPKNKSLLSKDKSSHSLFLLKTSPYKAVSGYTGGGKTKISLFGNPSFPKGQYKAVSGYTGGGKTKISLFGNPSFSKGQYKAVSGYTGGGKTKVLFFENWPFSSAHRVYAMKYTGSRDQIREVSRAKLSRSKRNSKVHVEKLHFDKKERVIWND